MFTGFRKLSVLSCLRVLVGFKVLGLVEVGGLGLKLLA